MTPITSDCSTEYEPAYHTSGKRLLTSIDWIVLHDEEAASAESAARYFQSALSGGSAHLCVDDLICYRCLPNESIPWGASSSFGANEHGFHIEQAGFAKWSAVVWLSHIRTLRRAAFKTAQHCRRFDVPTVFVTADQLVAGVRTSKPAKGVTTHNEVSKASRTLDPLHAYRYSHSDPGPLWPRRVFMLLVRRYALTVT